MWENSDEQSNDITIVPIIICGGEGVRLWPLSSATKPKQFHKFGNRYTLFQQSVLRSQSAIFHPTPIVVGSNNHVELISNDLEELDVTASIVLEPLSKNTSAAITAGCLHALARHSSNVIVMVMAADHHIPDISSFAQEVDFARPLAQNGRLVTFGIKPLHPATGYGYIEPGVQLTTEGNFAVKKFTEKPSLKVAKKLIKDGYLWNSGNFLFNAMEFLNELQHYQPEILKSVSEAYFAASVNDKHVHLNKEHFAKSPSISVDHALMEKTDRIAVRSVDYEWSDLGNWQSIWQLNNKSETGNSTSGPVETKDSTNCLVVSNNIPTTIVGLNNVAVVVQNNAVLVTALDQSEHVKKVEDVAKRGSIAKPWGYFERLDICRNYQIKRLVINPGGVLSLQKHEFRSEHWIVVKGVLKITIDGNQEELNENQSAYIPAGSVHRIKNQSDKIAILIEVQTGTYFGEDDIIRIEDKYNRPLNQMSD